MKYLYHCLIVGTPVQPLQDKARTSVKDTTIISIYKKYVGFVLASLFAVSKID